MILGLKIRKAWQNKNSKMWIYGCADFQVTKPKMALSAKFTFFWKAKGKFTYYFYLLKVHLLYFTLTQVRSALRQL